MNREDIKKEFKPLKGYLVYPTGSYPWDDVRGDGCLLVYAASRAKAKVLAMHGWPSDISVDYIDWTALRRQLFDQYAKGLEGYVINFNSELPRNAPKFYAEDYS